MKCHKQTNAIHQYWSFLLFCLLPFLSAPLLAQEKAAPGFSLLPAQETGIAFVNRVVENEKINILTYEYFHNGGGVAIGDVNNDGLPDIYLTGNLVPNRLFLNQGNMRFSDVTKQAGVAGSQGWTTGVTMVDINQDGWLDLYIGMSGDVPGSYRSNILFVNNQDGTFTERAAEYGIDDQGYATQPLFFDYDLDNDLDLFILNHNILPIQEFKPTEVRATHDPNVGDKLYRNDNGRFTDVSREAGLTTNPLGYGLGVSAGDVNNDGWPDLYIANDFIEHDYFYVNKGDGTFTEQVKQSFPQISQFSMGTDIADFNNDGWLDILSVDMVAEDNYRQKTTMRPMNRSTFYYAVEDGFHYQYMHNALQLNRGNLHFSNISRMAGVSNTDWSWAPLFIDIDLDGHKDLVVTNGYKKDISNKDYVTYEKKLLAEYKEGKLASEELFQKLLDKAPVTKISNYVFRNNGDLTFSKMNATWNFDHKAFSNGMAYGDLDQDGDLDLVISNIDDPVFLYRNETRTTAGPNFLRIQFEGPAGNRNGIGARVWLRYGDTEQTYEHYLTRGFQSSMEPGILAGTGNAESINTLEVRWPDGRRQLLSNVSANQTITLTYSEAKGKDSPITKTPADLLFEDVTDARGLDIRHVENTFDDFDYEVLLPHKMSNFGPGLAVADVNGDGLDDFFTGGASGSAGKLMIQQKDGTFRAFSGEAPWTQHAIREDMGCAFFDADGDGDADLYVVSGGNEFEAGDQAYQDRLYRNDGSGNFTDASDALPEINISGSCVKPDDFDGDGDLDLFVGGRMTPRAYPTPADSYLLRNEGGRFTNVTETTAPALLKAGMVTDATWADFDNDGDDDLMLSGEWMAITIFENRNGKFEKLKGNSLDAHSGWWFSVAAADMDGDGDTDFIGGNLGTNYKYQTNPDNPFQVYLNDFDENGSLDIVLSYYDDGTLYPLRGRQCSSEQMPFIKKKFPTYDLFGKAQLADIYGQEALTSSLNYKATDFQTCYIENLGSGQFDVRPLPVEAQLAAVNTILVRDFDGDGHPDLLLAGNLHASEVETPRNDAGVGLLLKGDGKGNFSAVPAVKSGFYLPYDIRGMAFLQSARQENLILAAPNNEKLRVIKLHGGKGQN